MYGCESWTIKTAECQRIDAFELWCWKTLESPLDCKEIKPVHPKGNQPWIFIHWKDWCWRWNSNTLATSREELTRWKRPWCWRRLGAGGEGDDRRWDGWMASLTPWTWVWVNSGSWWWTGRSGVLWFMGSQRVRHDWATELNWCSFYACFWRVFIINGCWILSNDFLASTDIIIWFLSFNLLTQYITLIDLQILKNPCIPGIKPTWSRCMIFLMCCWTLVRIFLRIFASMFISDIGL